LTYSDYTLHVYDLLSLTKTNTFHNKFIGINKLLFTSNSSLVIYLTLIGNSELHLWNLHTNQIIRVFKPEVLSKEGNYKFINFNLLSPKDVIISLTEDFHFLLFNPSKSSKPFMEINYSQIDYKALENLSMGENQLKFENLSSKYF
jgi:WD40 repeat protein